MKKPKSIKKSKTPVLTEEEIKKLAINAGFTFVIDKKVQAFGKPDERLNKETVIITETGQKIRVK